MAERGCIYFFQTYSPGGAGIGSPICTGHYTPVQFSSFTLRPRGTFSWDSCFVLPFASCFFFKSYKRYFRPLQILRPLGNGTPYKLCLTPPPQLPLLCNLKYGARGDSGTAELNEFCMEFFDLDVSLVVMLHGVSFVVMDISINSVIIVRVP